MESEYSKKQIKKKIVDNHGALRLSVAHCRTGSRDKNVMLAYSLKATVLRDPN